MKERFSDLKFSDSFMFGQVMSDKYICRKVLEALLCEDIGELTDSSDEKTIRFTSQGKPIRLDILSRDNSSGKLLNTDRARERTLQERSG